MLKQIKTFIIACTILWGSSPLQATPPFQAVVRVGPAHTKIFDTNIHNLIQELKTSTLEQLAPFYTSVAPTAFGFNLRGIGALGNFPANSTTLNVVFPQLGISESFTGSTRDESLQLFKQFLGDNANDDQGFLRAHARLTPIDPVAGNPNSLMAQMAQYDYSLGRLSPFSGCDCSWSSQPVTHQFQAGLQVGRAQADGFGVASFDTTIVSMPLRYSYSPSHTWAFIIDAPITFLSNGGAYSLVGSFGFGLRFPILPHWAMTPTFRFGTGGSIDLSCAGCFASPGIVSTIDFKVFDLVFTMINSANYYCSTPFHLGGLNFDYHMQNYCFKNGFTINTCDGFDLCGRSINASFSFVDTDFEGDTLFIKHYDEVGFSFFTTNVLPCIDYDCLSLGMSYQFGQKKYKGCFLNIAYQF